MWWDFLPTILFSAVGLVVAYYLFPAAEEERERKEQTQKDKNRDIRRLAATSTRYRLLKRLADEHADYDEVYAEEEQRIRGQMTREKSLGGVMEIVEMHKGF